jgi:hypothetical protein
MPNPSGVAHPHGGQPVLSSTPLDTPRGKPMMEVHSLVAFFYGNPFFLRKVGNFDTRWLTKYGNLHFPYVGLLKGFLQRCGFTEKFPFPD